MTLEGTLFNVTKSAVSLKPTFVPLVKPEGYVPTPRATVASTFKPPLVCAVRNRVTPQPRPPYLPNNDPVGGEMADFVLDELWSYRFGADLGHDWGMATSSTPIEQVPGVYGYTPLPGLVKTGNPHAYVQLQAWIADNTITQEEYDLYYKAIFEDPFRPKIQGSPDRQSLPALSSALAFDIYEMPDAINDPSTNTVSTYTKSFKFRITSGEWPSGTALPTEFLPEHTDQLLDVDTVGVRSQLEITARNVEIQFPATATPVHRVFIVPADVYFYGATTPGAGVWFNKVYDADGIDIPLTAGSLSLSGRPYTGRSGLTGFSNEFHIRDYRGVDEVVYVSNPSAYWWVVPYYVFVTEARSDAFSVFLRSEVISPSQVKLGPSPASSDMAYSTTANKFDSALGTLRIATLQTAATYSGSSAVENTDGAAHTITRSVVVTYSQAVGTATAVSSTTNNVAALFFAAYDTVTDGLGASGHIQPTQNRSTGTITTTFTSGADFTQFTGSGTLPVTFSSSTVHTVTGTPSYVESHGQSLQGLLTLTYTYWQV